MRPGSARAAPAFQSSLSSGALCTAAPLPRCALPAAAETPASSGAGESQTGARLRPGSARAAPALQSSLSSRALCTAGPLRRGAARAALAPRARAPVRARILAHRALASQPREARAPGPRRRTHRPKFPTRAHHRHWAWAQPRSRSRAHLERSLFSFHFSSKRIAIRAARAAPRAHSVAQRCDLPMGAGFPASRLMQPSRVWASPAGPRYRRRIPRRCRARLCHGSGGSWHRRPRPCAAPRPDARPRR